MANLRIAVDAHAIGRRQTGNEVYIRSLIQRYPRLAPHHRFIAYLSCREAEAWTPSGFERRLVSSNPFLRLGVDLPRRLRADRPDLLHVQYTAPLFRPVPIVVTIHDVSYLERPDFLPRWRALQLRTTTRAAVRRAAKIITISEFSRRRIAAAYNLDPAAIAVTPLAAQERFRLMDRAAATRQVRERFGFERPFVLHVGDLHPRKNQIGLIRAFRELLRERPELPHALVLVGKHTGFAPKVLDEVRRSGLGERVVLTRFVEDDLLPALYNAADLFVFPSFYEGFGLPAIEAMACGAPVACSDASALPEVVDGAALLFDPNSEQELTRAMRDILLNPEMSRRMRRRGLHRAAVFDWRRTAAGTLDAYHEVVEAEQRVPRRELIAR